MIGVLVAINLISSIMLIILILASQSTDAGLINTSSSRFAPGSLDNAKNYIIRILIAVFIVSILSIAAIEHRASKAKLDSSIDKYKKKHEKTVHRE